MSKQTDWTFIDANGTEWSEHPHSPKSSVIVEYRPKDGVDDDDDRSIQIGHEGDACVQEDCPIDAILACLARGIRWINEGMPEGTKVVP